MKGNHIGINFREELIEDKNIEPVEKWLFLKPNLIANPKKIADLSMIVLLHQNEANITINKILKTLKDHHIKTPIYILDCEFNLQHHNEATSDSNVIGYGNINEDSSFVEINNYLKLVTKHHIELNETAYKVGWAISGITDEDYREDRISKLFVGEMREFINKVKSLIDSIRPNEFQEDLTMIKNPDDSFQQGNIPKWLELWHAAKQGRMEYSYESAVYNDLKQEPDYKYAERLFTSEPSNSTQLHILLRGETGVGKTLLCYFIHQYYYRDCPKTYKKSSPLIASCPEFNDSVGLSTLFGGIVGSWTGATSRSGFLLNAYNGSLVLDEIGDASKKVQSKLLRYLDTKKFRPDGWNISDEIYSPVLVIGTTNKDLEKMIAENEFRKDLYNRFQCLEVPPLRNYKNFLDKYIDFELQNPDVNPYVESSKKSNDKKKERYIKSITKEAVGKLIDYNYPGNYRQFRRILKNAVMTSYLMRTETIYKSIIEKMVVEENKHNYN